MRTQQRLAQNTFVLTDAVNAFQNAGFGDEQGVFLRRRSPVVGRLEVTFVKKNCVRGKG